eukprot:Phypoly_transcript_01375.p1 GENE.Phypoly_transcript_01375~~Phypoly_transcript_01375.p1  ORF type:complete len:1095 (+),score=165.56 Phypoly_transcript_01375:41-3286(+)
MGVTVEQLTHLCEQALHPNTEIVRAAVTQLNAALTDPQSTMLFLALLQQSPHTHVKQFAAVVMRKRVVGHYYKLPQNERGVLKASLLLMLHSDTKVEVIVRRAVADVVVTLGKAIVPRGDWNVLLPTILNAASSAVLIEDREIAMYLLAAVIDSLGDQMREHYASLHTLLAACLRDSNPSIRSLALHTTSALIPWLVTKDDIALYGSLIPLVVDVVKYFVQNEMDDDAIESFSILEDLVETPIPVITKFIPALVNLMLEICANHQVDISVRQSALSFVQLVVRVKPKMVVKNKLVTPTLAAAFAMCAEGEGNDEAQQDLYEQEETLSPYIFGSQVIDTVALSLPVNQVIGPSLALVAQYGRPEMHFRQRRAAITAITVLTEGCAESIKDTLAKVVQYVVGALVDPSFLVRQAACLAIGQCADNLQPEIIDYHNVVVPALLQGLRDPMESVVLRCCYALEAFCESMGDKIVPYLATFMEYMGEVMRTKGIETQEVAVSAISSATVAAGPLFVPYFGAVYELMRTMMMATGLGATEPEKIIVVRARATECIGLCALAVGEPAKGIVHDAMSLALAGLELGFSELNEFTFGFFCNFCELLGADFVNYLPVVMPHIWKACESSDGIFPTAKTQLEVEGDDEEPLDVSVRTSFLYEKSAACQAIGSFAIHVKVGFIPFVDQSIAVLNPLLNYFHETVRAAAIVSIQQIAVPIHTAFPPPTPFVPGDLTIPLSTQSKEYSTRVMPVLISAMRDKSSDVVVRASDSIGEIAQLLGPVAVAEFMPAIVEEFSSILQQKSPCQIHFTEGDELDDEGNSEDEEGGPAEEEEEDDDARFLTLLDNVTECMVDLAHALGSQFTTAMQAFFPQLMKYARNSAHHSLRATSIGAMAETIKGAHTLPPPDLTSQLFQLGLNGMTNRQADPDIQRTAAFLCGVVIEMGGNNMETQITNALQALHPLFGSPDPTVIDNACGAVARIILTFPDSPHVPIEFILPTLLPALPLRKDHQEDEPVWKCVAELTRSAKVNAQGETTVALLETILRGLENPPLQPQLKDLLKHALGGWFPTLQALSSSTPSLVPLLHTVTNKNL